MTLPVSAPSARRIAAMAFAGLAVFHGAVLATWRWWDDRPPTGGAAALLREGRRVERALSEGRLLAWFEAVPTSERLAPPPVVPLVLALGGGLGRALGRSPEKTALWFAAWASLMVAAWGAYRYAAAAWGPAAGPAAAVMVSCLPLLRRAAQTTVMDAALAAVALWAFGLWRASEGFARVRATLSLGIVLGAGCLVHWTFPLFVLPVLIAVLFTFFVERRNKRKILLGAVAAWAVVTPWYLVNATVLVPAALRFVKTAEVFAAGPLGDVWIGGESGVRSILWAAAGAAGLAWCFARRPKDALALAAWIALGAFAGFAAPLRRSLWLTAAWAGLPLAAAALPRRWAAVLSAAAAIGAGIAAWGPGAVPRGKAPDWPVAAILVEAARRSPGGDAPAVLTVVTGHPRLSGETFAWAVEASGAAGRLEVRAGHDRLGRFAEFLVLETGGPDRPGEPGSAARAEALHPAGWIRRSFVEAGRWPLPEGGEAVLWQRARSSTEAGPTGFAGLLAGLPPDVSLDGFEGSLEPSDKYPGLMICRLGTERLTIGPFAIARVRLVMDGLAVARDDAGQTRLLDLRRLDLISARWSAADAETLLRARVPSLREPRVAFLDDNRVEVSAAWWGLPLRLRADVQTRATPAPVLEARVDRFQIGPLRVPVIVLGPWRRRRLALTPTGRLPFRVGIPTLRTVPEGNGDGNYLEWGTP